MTLSDIACGESCRVLRLNLEGAALQRVLAMGFLPKLKIKVLRNAPLFDPLEVLINKTMVAIRRSEAALIEVESL
ncbi:MAG: iron transporter FeoA [Treponema sp.]|nr:MAG: iron transporter FeoA [Treponema sp.]